MEPDDRPARPVVLVAEALATDAAGRIPLVRNMGDWWLPGGRVEAGEPFVAAAVREMAEETGLDLEPEGIVRITQQTKEDRHVIFVTVRGSVTGEMVMPQGDPKITEVRWVTREELAELVPEWADVWLELLEAPAIQETVE